MTNLASTQIYAILGIVLIILEIVVPGFVMMPMGVAFLITSALSSFVPDFTGQLFMLAVNLILTFLFFSKVIRPKLQRNRFLSNAEALVGQKGTVEEEINPKLGTGYIKIYGDSWKAITADGSIIKLGSQVIVERLDGNKVFVKSL